MPRISDLTSYTAPSNSDLLAIVDMAGAVTKKITRADLLKGTALPADTVTTPAIADGAVAYAKLLSTIFSGQLTTYTNPGTAGGTFYYGNIGGIKIFYGKTQFNAVGTGGASYTITLPVGFFSTIRYSAPTVDTYTIDDRQWATTVTVTTATYTLGIKSSSNGSTQVTNVLILGT